MARGSLYTSRLLKIHGPTHKVNELEGCQMFEQLRAAADVLMGMNEITSVSKARWYAKSKKEVIDDLFYW